GLPSLDQPAWNQLHPRYTRRMSQTHANLVVANHACAALFSGTSITVAIDVASSTCWWPGRPPGPARLGRCRATCPRMGGDGRIAAEAPAPCPLLGRRGWQVFPYRGLGWNWYS